MSSTIAGAIAVKRIIADDEAHAEKDSEEKPMEE